MLHLDSPVFSVIEFLLSQPVHLFFIPFRLNLLLQLFGVFLLLAQFARSHLVLSSNLHDVWLVVYRGILLHELPLRLLLLQIRAILWRRHHIVCVHLV